MRLSVVYLFHPIECYDFNSFGNQKVHTFIYFFKKKMKKNILYLKLAVVFMAVNKSHISKQLLV